MLPLPPLLALPSTVRAYTWTFTSTPKQCSNLSLEVSGGGTPPFSAFIQTSGPTPLANSIEVRRELDLDFNTSTSLSFQLKYPEDSQFIVVVRTTTLRWPTGSNSLIGQRFHRFRIWRNLCSVSSPEIGR